MQNVIKVCEGFLVCLIVTLLVVVIMIAPFAAVLAGPMTGEGVLLALLVGVFFPPLVLVWLGLSVFLSLKLVEDRRHVTGVWLFVLFIPAAIGVYQIYMALPRPSYPKVALDPPLGKIPILALAYSTIDASTIMYLKQGYAEKIVVGSDTNGRFSAKTELTWKPSSQCVDEPEGIEAAQRIGFFDDCIVSGKPGFGKTAPKGTIIIWYVDRYDRRYQAIAASVADEAGQFPRELLRWEKKGLEGPIPFTIAEMVAAVTGKPSVTVPHHEQFGDRVRRVRSAVESGNIIFPDLAFKYLVANLDSTGRSSNDGIIELDELVGQLCAMSNVRAEYSSILKSGTRTHYESLNDRAKCEFLYKRYKDVWVYRSTRDETLR